MRASIFLSDIPVVLRVSVYSLSAEYIHNHLGNFIIFHPECLLFKVRMPHCMISRYYLISMLFVKEILNKIMCLCS